jgi:diketogulonate reductase-like aldo/keto reductase
MTETYRLNTNDHIPKIGFGTWEVTPDSAAQAAVSEAIKAGYRLIDTALMYNNEQGVGRAIQESGLARDELFVTTKLWSDHLGYQSALDAFETSLTRLELDYVDLYLIHWPASFRHQDDRENNQKLRKDTWKAMEEISKSGRARNIGVSNFVVHHLEELLKYANVIPAVNQIEFHPFIFEEQRPIVEMCQKYEILIEAYSPLSRGGRVNDPVVQKIAQTHGKSSAQILIRWALQHDTLPLPRSTNSDHIAENFDVYDFELTPEDMHTLNGLTDSAGRVAPDPHKMK